jgi:hypothetical protein
MAMVGSPQKPNDALVGSSRLLKIDHFCGGNAVVEQRFKAVDTDNDGTLTPRELRTKAGRQLLRLLITKKFMEARSNSELLTMVPLRTHSPLLCFVKLTVG